MAKKRALTRSQVDEARRRVKGGETINTVARGFGVHYDTVRRLVDDKWRRLRREGINAARNRRRRQERIRSDGCLSHHPDGCVTRADAEKRLAEIPEDDGRDLTARLMGDPNPTDHRQRRGVLA